MVRKLLKILLVAVMALVAITAVSFIPTLWRSSAGMKALDGQYVTVYYQTQNYAAVFGKSKDVNYQEWVDCLRQYAGL